MWLECALLVNDLSFHLLLSLLSFHGFIVELKEFALLSTLYCVAALRAEDTPSLMRMYRGVRWLWVRLICHANILHLILKVLDGLLG